MVEIGMIIAVIVGLGQLAKMYIPKNYIPLLSLVLGVVAGVLFLNEATVQENVLVGVMMGLTASGLYDQKKIVKPSNSI